jgi:O-methyltransferase involved in polyketide biosynthesis
MELPSTLKWIEVDLPEILEYKQSVLAKEKPFCELQIVPLDLSDRGKRLELFNRLNKQCYKALILSEGLIGYLDDEEVAALAADLSAQHNFRRWVFDLMSPGLLAMALQEMGSYLSEGNALLKFAPAEGEEFFLPYGWRSIESKSKLKTAATLNRLSEEMLAFAAYPEPEGPKGEFPWTGACLLENMNTK